MLDLRSIALRLRAFAEQRDWAQFHSPKNLAAALTVEAAELLELFQWLTEDASRNLHRDPTRLEKVRNELADILIYAIRLSDSLAISLPEAIDDKIRQNAEKYPIDKSRGNAKKYDEL